MQYVYYIDKVIIRTLGINHAKSDNLHIPDRLGEI